MLWPVKINCRKHHYVRSALTLLLIFKLRRSLLISTHTCIMWCYTLQIEEVPANYTCIMWCYTLQIEEVPANYTCIMWCYTLQIEEVPVNYICIMSPDWGGPCWGSCDGAGKTCGLVSRLGVGGVSQPRLYQVHRHLWHPRGPHCHERNPAVQGGWVQHYATVT